jgi:hypothetical protein
MSDAFTVKQRNWKLEELGQIVTENDRQLVIWNRQEVND